jgi:N-acetylglucosamine-6-sulfatase
MKSRILLLGVAAAVLAGAGALPQRVTSGKVASANPAARSTLPNIVFILTDDERWDTLWALPTVQQQVVNHGVTFDDAFVVNSECCPSRASILTGDYSHTTGVYGNGGTHGGFHSFNDSNTLPIWLNQAGYQTALIGKYLNGYSTPYIPPGWNEWDVFFAAGSAGAAYYNYYLDENGILTWYGQDPTDYSTDVLATKADAWLRAADPAKPVFLDLSVFSGHAPYTPSPTYQHAFSNLPPYRPANYNEDDVSDKPAWVQALPVLTQDKQKVTDRQRRNAYRSLLSADDAVNEVLRALTDTGRISNTMIVFASDNGLAVGEHRWTNKKNAYEESIRVPMVIRYDPLTYSSPKHDTHLVLNLDLAPTFAELAGIPPPTVDGASLMPFIESSTPPPWRTDFLVEHRNENDRDEIPTFCAVRNENDIYVYYQSTKEEELYDLVLDPFELDNKVNDPAYKQILGELRTRKDELCQPPPPP